MFSSAGESQTLPSTGLHWLQASSLRLHWKHMQNKTSLPPSSSVRVDVFPHELLGRDLSGLLMGRVGALQPGAVAGSHPMWAKGHNTGCNGRHVHLQVLMMWAADLGFVGGLGTEHILFPCSPSAAWLAISCWRCAPCTSPVAVQECTS